MDIIGYYLTFTNLLAIGGRSPDPNDILVKIADLSTLANYLKNYPGFNIQDFKDDQINHVGDVGMYLSSNLRKFCHTGEGNAKDEGVIITFTYKIPGSTSEDDEKEPNLAEHSFLISRKSLSDDTVRPLLQQLLHNYNPQLNRFFIIKGKPEA